VKFLTIQLQSANRMLFLNAMKIILAATGGIALAQILHLQHSISAGIVAILTIQPTKKETLQTALTRFYAFVVSLVLAYVSFELLGFSISGFLVYFSIYIILCHMLHWYYAMTMNAVLISHFVTYGVMNEQAIWNEIMIFVIGVGTGIIANLHLRKNVDAIENLKEEADTKIIEILHRMSEQIVNVDMTDYNAESFIELRKMIRNAKNVAEENYLNQFNKDDRYDIEYIMMRDRQCQVLYEMYKNVRKLDSAPETAKVISHFLKMMAMKFHRDNDGHEMMKQFREMDVYMKRRPLPVERLEFENRARLFVVMRNMEEFIQIKTDFSKAQEGDATAIANKAFKNNKKLKSVTIGKNVKKIGKEAFYNCKKLKRITIKTTKLKSVGKNAIKGIYKKATIKVPKKQLKKYKKLFKSKTGYKKTMKIKK